MTSVVYRVAELRVDGRGNVLAILSTLFFLSDFPYGYLAVVAAGYQVLRILRSFAYDAGYRIGVFESFLRFQND